MERCNVVELALIGLLLAVGAYGILRMRSQPPGVFEVIPEPEPVLRNGGRLTVIGDSLGVGLSDRLKQRTEQADVALSEYVKVGVQTSYWSSRLPSLDGVSALLVVLGTNDAAGSGKDFETSMRHILDEAEKSGVPVVWVQPTGKHLPNYTKVMNELSAALEADRINTIVPSPIQGYASDQVHLTGEAYREWADRIWTTLTGEENEH